MNRWVVRLGGVGVAGLAALAAGVVVERRVVKARRAVAGETEEYRSLRAPEVVVSADQAPLIIGQRVLVKFKKG